MDQYEYLKIDMDWDGLEWIEMDYNGMVWLDI